MGRFMELYYSLARQHQADIACGVTRERLAGCVRAGRGGGTKADGPLHRAAALRPVRSLTHALGRWRGGRPHSCEEATQLPPCR
jgi:hypothetical protein